jgi:hypothetical protein
MLPNFAVLDRESLTVQISDTLPADLALRADELSRFLNTAARTTDRRAAKDLRLRGDTTDADLLLVASSLWHEKRHFLDLVLTNYGAALFRQAAEIQFDLFGALREQRATSRDLLIPVGFYLDEVRLAIAAGGTSFALAPDFRTFLKHINSTFAVHAAASAQAACTARIS